MRVPAVAQPSNKNSPERGALLKWNILRHIALRYRVDRASIHAQLLVYTHDRRCEVRSLGRVECVGRVVEMKVGCFQSGGAPLEFLVPMPNVERNAFHVSGV